MLHYAQANLILDHYGIEHQKAKTIEELAELIVAIQKNLLSDTDSLSREVLEEIADVLSGFKGSAIFVSHSRDEIYRLCDSMIVIDSGKISNLGKTKDIFKNPNNPILRMYDDEELIGTFNILTGEVLEDLDLADYDIRFAQKQIELNRDNYLETWKDYVGLLHA